MSKPREGARPSIDIKNVLVVRRKSFGLFSFKFRMHSMETYSMNGENCRFVLVFV